MTEEERRALIEEAASAWRPSSDGEPTAHPAWEQLDEAGRIEAFEIAESLRRMEAALDSDGLSTAGKAVLQRLKLQQASGVAPADEGDDDVSPEDDGRPARSSDGGLATVLAFPTRILRSQPLAIAATAMLAIGIGLWMSPDGTAPSVDAPSGELAVVDQEELQEPEEEEQQASSEIEERVELAAAEREASRPARQAVQRERRQRRRRAESGEAEEPVDAELSEDAAALAAKKPPPEKRQADEPSDEPDPRGQQPELGKFAQGTQPGTGTAKSVSEGEQARSATEQERRICGARVSVLETLLSQNEDYEPVPEEQLAVGRCYRTLGKNTKAAQWLRRAAKHPETKARAEKALRELGDAQ